jgi:hypothetical protein
MNQYSLKQALIRNATSNEQESLPRSCPRKHWDERDARRIIRRVRMHPKASYADIMADLGLLLSKDTIRRILSYSNIGKWRAKLRPTLLPRHATTRLAFAQAHRDWTVDDWKRVIWSEGGCRKVGCSLGVRRLMLLCCTCICEQQCNPLWERTDQPVKLPDMTAV